MTQRTAGGRIVPFPMTAAYVRRKALENRREGRLLEAADLFRRGAELEEGVECLVDLAQVLAAMGCRQQACQTLCRAIIQEPMRPDAYYHLALCYLEMGRQQEAADCAANCLALDPAGPYAEEIQELMEHLAQPDGVPESNRQGVLARRSVVYQRQGCDEKARQAFKRALRASRKTPFMLYSMGFLLLEQGDAKGALRHAQMALKSDPQSCHAHCLRCMALCDLGNEPLSEKLLDALSLQCANDKETLVLCATARRTGREAQALCILKRQLQRRPYSIPLLEEAALSHWRLMQVEQARRLWLRILRIDPANDSAKVCLGMAEAGWHHPPREAGMIPHQEMLARVQRLTLALSQGPQAFGEIGEATPRWEDVVAWAFTLPPCGLHQPLLEALTAWPKEKAGALLRPLLLDLRVAEEVRRQIVEHLILSGEQGPFLMLYEGRITQVDRQQAGEKLGSGWRRFLNALLAEFNDVPDTARAAAFAGRCWQAMTPDQRNEALGDRIYAWVMAVKLLALEEQAQIELENQLALHLPISVRRVERIMALLEKQLALKEASTNEAD